MRYFESKLLLLSRLWKKEKDILSPIFMLSENLHLKIEILFYSYVLYLQILL